MKRTGKECDGMPLTMGREEDPVKGFVYDYNGASRRKFSMPDEWGPRGMIRHPRWSLIKNFVGCSISLSYQNYIFFIF